MPIGKMWIYQLLFVCLFFCVFVWLRIVLVLLLISLPRIKLMASNFAWWFIGVLGRQLPILGYFARCSTKSSPRNQRPWTCQKEFLLFMCQLWALHVVIKREFFYIYICRFFTKFILQMHIIAHVYLRCCGVAKTNGSYTGILLVVSIW